MARTDYDATLARIAGNIVSGMAPRIDDGPDVEAQQIAKATRMAAAIVEHAKADALRDGRAVEKAS